MGYLVTMSGVASVTHSRRSQKWHFVLTFIFLQQAVRVSRLESVSMLWRQICWPQRGEWYQRPHIGQFGQSLIGSNCAPAHHQHRSQCIFSTAALTTACSSLLQWPWWLQFLTNCSVPGCRPDAPAGICFLWVLHKEETKLSILWITWYLSWNCSINIVFRGHMCSIVYSSYLSTQKSRTLERKHKNWNQTHSPLAWCQQVASPPLTLSGGGEDVCLVSSH